MKQVFIGFIVLIAATFATGWTFNHINAWAGIGLGILFSYLIADFFLKKTTKK